MSSILIAYLAGCVCTLAGVALGCHITQSSRSGKPIVPNLRRPTQEPLPRPVRSNVGNL